jgi:hypothetical protein
MEPTRAFDSLVLPAVQIQLATPGDTKDLVRIEGFRDLFLPRQCDHHYQVNSWSMTSAPRRSSGTITFR